MERKLRYIEKEIKKDKIPVLDTGENPESPAPREMIDLEVSASNWKCPSFYAEIADSRH